MTTATLKPPITAPASSAENPNARSALALSVQRGRLGWAGPLFLVFGRTALCVLAQASVGLFFWLRGHPTPWQAAAPYWTVWGTLVDLGCLAALLWFTRQEGLRLRDLISFNRRFLGRDLLLGVGIFVVGFPLTIIGGTMLASWLVFGTTQAPLYAGELTGRVLPLWAMLYSASIWWMIWSLTEELTYNGYALPRLEVLLGHRWGAVALVAFMYAAQHAAIPVVWDGQYLLWRTLAFLPLTLVMTVVYLRTRRLLPFILAHYLMDITGVWLTIAW
jgi:membrane protease YdiL (CAAX protease family)